MDGISLHEEDLDNLIIKDKEYYAKKRKKLILILAPILSVLIITIIIVLVILLKPKINNAIICQYKTEKDNQYINLIKYMKDVDFTLIIDNVKYNKDFSHNFEEEGIHNVTFEFKDKLKSLEGFFEDNKYLISADFSNLIAEDIYKMDSIFKNCINLENFTFNSDTPNLVNIRDMFYNCVSLTKVNLSINTTKVNYMDNMFYNSVNLKYLDLSKFNLENLVKSSHMFDGCSNLTEIAFNNNTKTINLEDMNSMFSNCKSLKEINTKIFKINKL